jgi:D-alanine-D-alanine ligase
VSRKLRVGLLFGGKSAEHEISLLSAKNVLEALDRDKYEPVLIGIDKSGHWHLGEASHFLLNADDPTRIALNQAGSENVALTPESEGRLRKLDDGQLGQSVDVVFPILHGPLGEDGTVQGLLRLAGVPFVGAGVLGSAVGMDKDVMKRLLRDAGIPGPAFKVFHRGEAVDYDALHAALDSPLFIKPANMGSSVGINRAANRVAFERAVEEAFHYDSKIVIEAAVEGREIECAVLGNAEPQASVAGEIIPQDGFYSYAAKYIDENGARLEAPARLDAETIRRIQTLAVHTFKTLCCQGMARVDLFLREDGTLLVNEINTLPGFTRISMYPRLWALSGLAYPELIDRLIALALERHREEAMLATTQTE